VRAAKPRRRRPAYQKFQSEELDKGTAQARAFGGFLSKNAAWLGEYAEFMALSS